ncbi:ferredoxin [Streptomyces sp. B21-101]|uniref:ferredoxin n=1 Tax=Streptomyces sp. B21-101 TaxID=3039415 RepID=UPI002FEFC1CF
MTFVITSECIDSKDRSCIGQCPVECIYEGERMVYIDPDECIDCGACVPVCPQGAIFRDDTLPEPLKEFEAINREFIEAVGDELVPGNLYPDHPKVAAVPPAAS